MSGSLGSALENVDDVDEIVATAEEIQDYGKASRQNVAEVENHELYLWRFWYCDRL
jgi:hypothetical protein